MPLDLTPFGFTPTESLVYGALLQHGTSSGYALGKALALARANVYQALHGLVVKEAAVVAQQGPPQLFRAVSPRALLARVIIRETAHLERLEAEVGSHRGEGEDLFLPISGRRVFEQLALRTVARAAGPARALAPPQLLEALMPVWRKRAADGTPTEIWVIGQGDVHLPCDLAGRISETAITGQFGGPVAFLTTREVGMLARVTRGDVRGYWTSDDVIVAVVAAAVSQALAASPSA